MVNRLTQRLLFFYLSFFAFSLVLPQSFNSLNTVQIIDSQYLNRPHFVIYTTGSTYFLDKAGGGFSSLVDPEGRDWIQFKMDPWDSYPASAASSYRGIPNFVFRSEDSGAGHPGHQQCISEVTSPNRIRTRSISGRWAWEFTFFSSFVKIEMIKTDPEHKYWFLFEGIPGGVWEPEKQFMGNAHLGVVSDAFDYYKGNKLNGNWQWIYFGHRDQKLVLFIKQAYSDQANDCFAYLGNSANGINSTDGMVVFGFGREEAQPLIVQKHIFYFGFIPYSEQIETAHHQLKEEISQIGNE